MDFCHLDFAARDGSRVMRTRVNTWPVDTISPGSTASVTAQRPSHTTGQLCLEPSDSQLGIELCPLLDGSVALGVLDRLGRS